MYYKLFVVFLRNHTLLTFGSEVCAKVATVPQIVYCKNRDLNTELGSKPLTLIVVLKELPEVLSTCFLWQPCWCALNFQLIINSVTIKEPPHHHTSSMLHGTQKPSAHLLCVTKTWQVEPKIWTYQTKAQTSGLSLNRILNKVGLMSIPLFLSVHNSCWGSARGKIGYQQPPENQQQVGLAQVL